MVTGGIVAFDSDAETYFLPAHHAALLTRSAGSNNFARTFHFLAVMAEVESPITSHLDKAAFHTKNSLVFTR